jgi:hypothetical protein
VFSSSKANARLPSPAILRIHTLDQAYNTKIAKAEPFAFVPC